MKATTENAPDLDGGWEEVESILPGSIAPPASVAPEVSSLDAGWDDGAGGEVGEEVDGGWEEEPGAAFGPGQGSPQGGESDATDRTRRRRRQRGAGQAAVLAKPVTILDAGYRALSKKERRELERRQQAHAKKQDAERKRQEKLDREARRQLDAAAQLELRKTALAEQARSERKPKPQRPPRAQSRREPLETETSPSPLPSRRSQKAAARREKSEVARSQRAAATNLARELSRRNQGASLAPWFFAIAVLAIVLLIAFIRH
jgi:hypothetical protein